MPDRYTRRILDHIADRRYAPSTVQELVEELSIPEDQQDDFVSAIDELLEAKQVVRGTADTIALPPPGKDMIGTFRRHEKGFGFLVPDELTEHGDLFIPPGNVGDAMTGDKVKAKVIHEKGRGGGKSPYIGKIIEVLTRSDKQYSGTLLKKGSKYGVQVDGRIFNAPVLIRDVSAKNARPGDKVVIDLIQYPDDRGDGAVGVITEVLGEAGEPDVETLAVMRSAGLVERFPDDVMRQAREAARRLDDDIPADREDLTSEMICTIDPPDAKDYDDAISVTKLDGTKKGEPAWELGVHIADVAHYITPGSALDEEAYERANSTYLPRKVVPMLPEVLSNGVCSLMEGVNRFAKSCFITYDSLGNVLEQRFAKTVIRSAKRLTYIEAQALIEDDLRTAIKHCKAEQPKYSRALIQCLKRQDVLAKIIRKRRLGQGMIVLGLPAVDLVFDETGRVVDAQPEDDAFTHKIIEMFMVEANEAAARIFAELEVPMVRRVHADPDAHDMSDLKAFARVAGYNIPAKPSRMELQQLLESVRDKPAQHAVHMAVLKTLSKAEYSPELIGHFALASEHYTHFTSPIRRYPDFVVHRSLDVMLEHQQLKAGKKQPNAKQLGKALRDDERIPNEEQMREIGRHCSTKERNSESAERELRKYLVLELLSTKLGEDYPATVTGVTGQGIYLQIDQYLIDGFISLQDLPGAKFDRWQFNRNTGALVAQRSGRTITIGDRFPAARIASVDLARRQLELVIIDERQGRKLGQGKPKGKAKASGKPAKPAKTGKKPRREQGERDSKADGSNKPRRGRSDSAKKKAHARTIKLKKHRGRKRK
ncbi:ribonuclease R family protein [Algisphaera agarilytica]|uniref:Ribonuclease R n=1 Tax=Algisphaera agarilytica TaxID=1385975 RepID=A0A7X0H5N7_9BACT|nr:VacB/RNase II family 3'-5' exoribonuclease [Algisphaera agarilytica]MBB6429746.1 ribonuclease R [Algisphaera agarilytica]